MTCNLKHIKYQPSNDEFKCPMCGSDEFCVEESYNFDCDLLHNDDYLKCVECGYDANGTQYEKLMKKRMNFIPCPHCKGTGLVKKNI